MTTYDEYLNQLKEQHKLTAKTALKRLYDLLKIEDPMMSKEDMYDRIVKDCLEIWQKQTIRNNMPEELKDPERVEIGKKNREKREPISLTIGNVATDSVANHAQESSENIVTNSNPNDSEDKIAEQHEIIEGYKQKIARNQEEIDRVEPIVQKVKELEEMLHESRENEKKVKEQLKEQSEYFHSTLKAINDNKDKSILETKEYKALQSEMFLLQEEITQLNQIVASETFQTATTMQRESNEIEFPARELSTLFMDARIAKQVMYLKIEGNKVIGWESDAIREKNQAKSKDKIRQAAQPA